MLRRFSSLYVKLIRSGNLMVTKKFASTSSEKADKWDLFAGVLVERLPIVSKELNEIEKEFQQYLWRVEFEKSLKSKYELQHEQEMKQVQLLKKGKIGVELDDLAAKQTAQDLKDAYIDELSKFTFSPRTTDDDAALNICSTNRCLDETLYLFVEHKLGSKNYLLLPQGPRLDGETMRQASERVLREKCGNKMNVFFYGNAPCGFYKYKYPATSRDKSVGAKVFFFRASLTNGNVDEALTNKYEWLQKEAIGEKLNISYNKSVKEFLF